jgi:hypothetical protein
LFLSRVRGTWLISQESDRTVASRSRKRALAGRSSETTVGPIDDLPASCLDLDCTPGGIAQVEEERPRHSRRKRARSRIQLPWLWNSISGIQNRSPLDGGRERAQEILTGSGAKRLTNHWPRGEPENQKPAFHARQVDSLLGSVSALADIPTMTVAAGLSIAMFYEVQRIGTDRRPFRGQLNRVVMAFGGLIVLAHCVRVLGFFVLVRVGLVGMPSQLRCRWDGRSGCGREFSAVWRIDSRTTTRAASRKKVLPICHLAIRGSDCRIAGRR